MGVVVSSWQASNIIWHLLTRLNAICVLISSLQQPCPLESEGASWFFFFHFLSFHTCSDTLLLAEALSEGSVGVCTLANKGKDIYVHTHMLADLGCPARHTPWPFFLCIFLFFLFDWISDRQTARSTCPSITTLSCSGAGEHVALPSAKTIQNEHGAHKWGDWQRSFFSFLHLVLSATVMFIWVKR